MKGDGSSANNPTCSVQLWWWQCQKTGPALPGPFMRCGQAREAGEVLGLTRAEEGVVVQEPRRAPSTETALEGAGLTLRTVGWGCPKQEDTPSPYLSASDS